MLRTNPDARRFYERLGFTLDAQWDGYAILRFADAEYDETVHQRTMVELLGTDHQEVVCHRADIANVFPTVVFHAERPLLRLPLPS